MLFLHLLDLVSNLRRALEFQLLGGSLHLLRKEIDLLVQRQLSEEIGKDNTDFLFLPAVGKLCGGQDFLARFVDRLRFDVMFFVVLQLDFPAAVGSLTRTSHQVS